MGWISVLRQGLYEAGRHKPCSCREARQEMLAEISAMNFRRLARRNSQDNYILENPVRSRAQPWRRCSLNENSSSKRMQNVVSTFGTMPRGKKQVDCSRSNSLVDYADPVRTTVVLEKQDNETFGFEVQTYGLQHDSSTAVEMCTFVCSVQEGGPAEQAGLIADDIIVRINGVCIEGSSHQHIVERIRESINVLTIETVSGGPVKKIHLERKLKVLKQSLQEKWVELRTLNKQEQQLTGGNLNDNTQCPSLTLPGMWDGPRFSSDSSYRSLMTEDSEDTGLSPCDFEYSDPFSPCHPARAVEEGGGVFFFPAHGGRPSVTRTRSISLGSNSAGRSSPSWDLAEASSPFGTLPRRTRQGSVRKRIMRFIPGLKRSVEEEENG